MRSRRSFIKTVAATTMSVPLFGIAKPGVSANEKLNFAAVGVGGRGAADLNGLMRTGQLNLLAIADVDDVRSQQSREKYPNARVYKDWRELLEKEGDELDLICVATPDHMHGPVSIEAMRMGIPVYGEKPLAHTLKETRYMSEFAKSEGLVTQMGSQYVSSMYERLAVQMLQDGVIGKVKEVHAFCHKKWGDPTPLPQRKDPVPKTLDWDLWLGTAESRSFIGDKYYVPGQWRKRLDFGTGTLGDMGCHILSPVFRALDAHYPLTVKSVGAQPNASNWALNEKVEYVFPGSDMTEGETLKVTWSDGAALPPKKIIDVFGDQMEEQGTIYVGTEGHLMVPFKKLPVPYPQKKYESYRYPKFPPRDHFRDFVSAVKGENVKPLADFYDYGGPLTEIVLLGALSTHFPNKLLKWDVNNLRFKNNREANRLVTKTYREGWEIEGIA
ncbi:Gfo/Idh/MocA family oxidoreductase [Pelagicoccus mobilis]|uniref:Gfo/Idh/MocA family oxidoreductase n=1 Tax=Pelagicoccus mobilis TaxID=415221 RepID=A0A934RYP7_9BACT|nr:Gfo/Idh/MocA family oxidoreductase [Pelagicoccus mobilis]MBK1877694.1 Gfo/Idh/MocA family oxidoreductase [Pelagicoccus mobilis]